VRSRRARPGPAGPGGAQGACQPVQRRPGGPVHTGRRGGGGGGDGGCGRRALPRPGRPDGLHPTRPGGDAVGLVSPRADSALQFASWPMTATFGPAVRPACGSGKFRAQHIQTEGCPAMGNEILAAASKGSSGGSYFFLLIIVAVLVLMYFVTVRPQRNRQRQV